LSGLVEVLYNKLKTESSVKSPNTPQNFISDWGTMRYAVSQGSILGPLLFIIHINHLPLRKNSVSEPLLFPDDISVIISSRN